MFLLVAVLEGEKPHTRTRVHFGDVEVGRSLKSSQIHSLSDDQIEQEYRNLLT